MLLLYYLFRYHYNRLKELCSCCADNEVVFPAMEAFEERLDNPTNYYIFYDYFLRASVGEKVWKQATGAQEKELRKKGRLSGASNESLPGSRTKRLSSCLEEAFALIMLEKKILCLAAGIQRKIYKKGIVDQLRQMRVGEFSHDCASGKTCARR